MNKQYIEPNVEVIYLSEDDVIVTSGTTCGASGNYGTGQQDLEES